MNIIITMAGRGSRFANQGFPMPKFMIEVHGKTLFEWSLESLKEFIPVSRWFFVALKEHNSVDFIIEKCSEMGIEQPSILEIDEVTSGQAETALVALELCPQDESCLIYNIDTHIQPEVLSPKDIRGDGWIPCFDMPGDHWSFVRLGADGCAVEVREKKRVSNMCSIGLYWFATTRLFLEAYDETYAHGATEAGETYIAPLYNALIQKGHCIQVQMIPSSAVIPLGTPEELKKAFEQ